MAAQQIYMFPEEHIAKLELELNKLRRGIFAKLNDMEQEMKTVSAVCDGNTSDVLDIKRKLEG